MRYVFADVELDPGQLELRRAGQRVALEPQAFDVLVYLVRHRDRVVAKEELMDRVWGGRFVSETAVTSRIKQVRRAVGDDGQQQSRIRTYHGRGYRFVADVTERPAVPEQASPGPAPAAPGVGPGRPRPNVGASRDDGLPRDDGVPESAATPRNDAADAGSGSGAEAALVPVLACGPADRVLRFQLSGQGPPDLLLLPAVQSLVSEWDDPRRRELLDGLGTMARAIRLQRPVAPAGAEQPSPELQVDDLLLVLDAAASRRTVVLAEDDGAALAARFAATVPDRIAGLVLFGAVAPEDAALEGIATPTLVLHRSGDPVVPIGRGHDLAARIPEAEFHTLSGSGHDAHADPAQVLDAVAGLVGDAAAEQAADQHLTALVGLSGGDVRALVSVLLQLGGRLRQGPEQSVIVSFEGPASALRALGSRRARGLLGEAGIGLAIDEVSRDSFLVSGHGVDVARLFAERAAPGEVLLPNVVRQLLAGSGLRVETLVPLDLPHVGPHPVHRWISS